jgi:hypothetical protein
MFAYMLLLAFLLLYIITIYNYRDAIALFNFLARHYIHTVQDMQRLFTVVQQQKLAQTPTAPPVPSRNSARLN